MRHLKQIRETDAGPIVLHWFHELLWCLIFDLYFVTNADAVTIKDETSKEICETDAGQIK